jgi:hypothetical protein
MADDDQDNTPRRPPKSPQRDKTVYDKTSVKKSTVSRALFTKPPLTGASQTLSAPAVGTTTPETKQNESQTTTTTTTTAAAPSPPNQSNPSLVPPLGKSERIKSSLLFLQSKRRNRAKPPSVKVPGNKDTVHTTPPAPTRTTMECVDQSLQRPVTWNNQHFEAFIQKTPPADAVCEICCEKVIALKEVDIECLSDIFRGLDSTCPGHATHAQLKQVLEQWNDQRSHDNQPTFDVPHLVTLAVVKDERIDYNLFVDAMKNTHCCQTLCVCRPSRWLHHHCLHKKLAIGMNNTEYFLLRCGYCRTSVWGTSYAEWYNEAVILLNNARYTKGEENKEARQRAFDEAYELAMDVLNAVIRCGGGGVVQNAILGDCLTLVGSVIYEQQQNSNGGVPRGTLAGQVCHIALRMGAPPTPRMALVLSEMHWTFKQTKNAERQRYWLDLAAKCCEDSKKYINEPAKATAISMWTELTSIQIRVHSPGMTPKEILKVFQQWPWGIEEMSAHMLYSMCFLLVQNEGVCYMAEYLERGERLVAEDPYAKNPVLFERLRIEYDKSLVVETDSTCVEE